VKWFWGGCSVEPPKAQNRLLGILMNTQMWANETDVTVLFYRNYVHYFVYIYFYLIRVACRKKSISNVSVETVKDDKSFEKSF